MRSKISVISKSALCLALAAALSCVREAEYLPAYELGSPQAEGLVSVSAAGGSVDCEVFANGDYLVTLGSQWLSFTGQSADLRSMTFSGDGVFSIYMEQNAGETRYGTVSLSRGNRELVINVRQRGSQSSDAGIIASSVAATPSSLTVTWTRDVDGETSPEPDYAYPYRFSLYRDASLQELVVSHESAASEACWNKRTPMFAFGGLEQGTSYWFLCEQIADDGEGGTVSVQHSDPLELSTLDFTPVSVPDSPASVGDVILAEDWSDCPWLSDIVSQSAGFIPPAEQRTSLDGPSGPNPEGSLHTWSSENELFSSSYSYLLENTRLRDWAKRYDHDITGRSSVFMHAGHVKIGASSYTAHIATPQLSCIPEGYEAAVEVKLRLARYVNDSDMTWLGSASGSSGKNATYGNWFKPESLDSPGVHFTVTNGWNWYSLRLSHLTSSSRILVGPDFELANTGNGASQHRLMVGDITVTLLSLNEILAVRADKVHYSDAMLSWNLLSDASVSAYELVLDGSVYASFSPEENSCHVTGLPSGSSHTASVRALRQGGESSESAQISFTTKDFSCYKAFSERICMQWDDLLDKSLYSSDTYARAYQIEVYRDEALSDLYISAYSYNGSGKNEGAFIGKPSTGICGKTGGTGADYYNAFPTRATAGSLLPSTGYWFRLRSVDGVQVQNYLTGATVTLTNLEGTSEWSLPVKVSTAAARTPSEKEVIFQGFDSFGVGADWTCYAAGIGPKLQTPAEYASTDMSSWSGEWCMFSMYSYSSMQMPLWGLSRPCEGEGEDSYLNSSVFSYGGYMRPNYVDADGWHYDGNLGALMGQLHLCDMVTPSNSGCFFGTPQLENNLSDEPRTCIVSFGAFATGASYTTTASKELYVRVYHPDTGEIEDGVKLTLPVRYIPATGATSSNYMFDVSFYPLQAEVTLKKGDVVIVANQMASNRVIVDDFLIELK